MSKKSYNETLAWKMIQALKGMGRLFKERLAENDIALTPEEVFLLTILDDEEKLVLKELAEILDKDKSAISRQISSLEEKHFIARTVDSSDKRRKILFLTKQGVEELQKARAAGEVFGQDIREGFSDEILSEFERFLTNIYNKKTDDK